MSRFTRFFVFLFLAACSAHAVRVRYKEIDFGMHVREAYESLYLISQDTAVLAKQWDSLLVDSPCRQRSARKVMDCYLRGGEFRNMTQQECCLARTKGKFATDLAARLMEARGQYGDLRVAIESGKITEHVEIRENTYTADLFFDPSGRFWKYEVSGNRYVKERMPMVFAEADSLLRFMEAKYGRPTWRAKRTKLTFSPDGESYYANWEFKEYIMYLVIAGASGRFAAKEVVMDRKLAREYEQTLRKQGKKSQTLMATPK